MSNKSYTIRDTTNLPYSGDPANQSLAFSKVAIPFMQVLFSGVPIEMRPALIAKLQNTLYSPHVEGLLAPDIDLSAVGLSDLWKVWNAYQSLLLSVLAETGRDELFKKFRTWSKILGGDGLPEDVLKSILEGTNYSEIAPGLDGDISYQNYYSKLPDDLLSSHYHLGLKHIAGGGRFDEALLALANVMAYDEFSSRVHEDKFGGDDPDDADDLSEGGLFSKKSKEARVLKRADKKARKVEGLMKRANLGRAVRVLGEDIQSNKFDELSKSLPPQTLSQIKDAVIDVVNPAPIQDVSDLPKVYDVPGVGIIASPKHLKDQILTLLSASEVVMPEDFESMQAVNQLIDETAYDSGVESSENTGDLQLADLLMMGHQVRALVKLGNLYKRGHIVAGNTSILPGSSSSNAPSGPLFTIGDVIMGDLIVQHMLRDGKVMHELRGADGEGDLNEGFLPLLAAGAVPAVKAIGKLVSKTGIGRVIGGGAKKAAGAVFKGIKNIGGKIFGKAKRIPAAIAGTVATGLAVDTGIDMIKKNKAERTVDSDSVQEDVTKGKSIQVIPKSDGSMNLTYPLNSQSDSVNYEVPVLQNFVVS